MPTDPETQDFRRDRSYPVLREYKLRQDVPDLLRRHGAHSVGIAPKVVAGRPTGKLALTFYVAAKADEETLNPAVAVPRTLEFRTTVDKRVRRITTDVVQAPQASFEIDPKDRHRPVPGGVSVAPPTGTLGGWVWDETDDTIVALSNEHVFGSTPGVNITQPGVAVDGGSHPADTIGQSKRGIPRTTVGTNTVDCAVMAPNADDVYQLVVHDIGPAVYAVTEPVLNLLIEKFGRTTEHTYGRIISTDYATTLTSGHFFDDCLRIEPVAPSTDWSDGGDSGSVVFSQTPTSEGGAIKPAVGLHFAGGGIYGVACKIQNVFAALDLTTLCSGAFAAFLESMNESEAELPRLRTLPGVGLPPQQPWLTTADLPLRPSVATERPMLSRAGGFTDAVRRHAEALRPVRGLARDVQLRLQSSDNGRRLTDAVDTHRGELLTLLARDGDVRRSTTAALRPLVRDAVTTDEVLARVLDDQDVARLTRLADAVSKRAEGDLAAVVADLRTMVAEGAGRSLADIVGLHV